MAVLATVSLWLVMTAGQVLATESTEVIASDSGEDFTGLLLAAAAGIVVGLLLFVDAYVTGPDDDGHESH